MLMLAAFLFLSILSYFWNEKLIFFYPEGKKQVFKPNIHGKNEVIFRA